VLTTHDITPPEDKQQEMIERCRNKNLACYTATELRHERDVLIGSRIQYALRCDSGGAHIGWDPLNGWLKTIQHPNALPSDRLDDEYYTHRANSSGPTVTGQEAGTPSSKDDRTTIEIFADWSAEALDKSGVTPDGELAGVLTSEPPGYTPKDGTAFAVNKWDAALSRGFKIWGVASGDSFAKSGQAVQERRLESLQAEWNASVKANNTKNMETLAEFIRSKPVGAGYIQIWLPEEEELSAWNLMDQVSKGQFYAVGNHHIGTSTVDIVSAQVSTDGTYTVKLASGSHDVTCEAVTNHGRVVTLQQEGADFSASVGAVCGSAGEDPFHCAYFRIQCKRPAVANPRYQYDFNYAWMQPHFLPNYVELERHFSDKPVHEFKAVVRKNKNAMQTIHNAMAKEVMQWEEASELEVMRTQCKSAEKCTAEVLKRAIQNSDQFSLENWDSRLFEVELGIDADVDQV